MFCLGFVVDIDDVRVTTEGVPVLGVEAPEFAAEASCFVGDFVGDFTTSAYMGREGSRKTYP
jgi:hypothetical protein